MVATTGIAIELQDRTKQGARAITRSLDDIKKSARETATSVDKLDDNFDRLKDELKETGRSADKAGREFDALAGKAKKAGDATGGMGRNFTALKGAFAAVGTSIVVKQFFDLLDVSTQINNRLKLVTDSTYALGLAQQQLFEVSQKSRVGFDQTVDLYSRLARSSEELGLTQRELVDITETISQAITISGASAQAADAALMQLGQGIASGALRGEELNSVLEQTDRLAQVIADGMGVAKGQLKDLGAEGKLTSETVIKAIQSQQGAVRTEFGQTSATVSQSMTVITNSLTKLVSKIDESAGVSDKLASSLLGIAEGLDALSDRPQIALQGLLGLLTGGATGLYSRAVQATTEQAVAGQAQAQSDEALNKLLFTVSEGFKDIATDVKAETELVKEAFVEGLKTRPATTGPRPTRQAAGPSLVGPASFAVDERVFSFEQNLRNVSTAREIESAAIDATIDAIRRFNPKLAEFADAGQDIYAAFTSGNVAAQITSVANGLFLLLDTFFSISDSGEKARRALEDLNRALEQADRSAQSVIEDLFVSEISSGREQIFNVFDALFNRLTDRLTSFEDFDSFFEANGGAGANAEAVRQLFDTLSTMDTAGFSEASQFTGTSLDPTLGLSVFDVFDSFQEFERVFEETFGRGSSLQDAAVEFFNTSEAFDHLRDSAEDATTAVDRLSAAEQAATRLRVNAQEIALRTQLSQEFRRAGSDVFEQRAAYNRFQQAVRQLQYMGRAGAALTGGGGGAGASTTAATTTATGGATATTTAAQVSTTTTQPLTVDFSGENLVIIRKEIDQWDQLLYGPVWDGTEKPEIDFNGSHKLHVWKRLIDDYNQMLYGPVWDGREKPEIDFNGSHKLHIRKRKIDDYDQIFYGPVYDGDEKLPVNFGNRIEITGKYALDDWSDIFRGWLISKNIQEAGFRPLKHNFGTPGFVEITGKYALDDWSDIFRGWLISKNTQEAGFRPLEYNFGTPGFVEITGKADLSADALISPPTMMDFFFLFADMVPDISAGLNSVLSGISAAITNKKLINPTDLFSIPSGDDFRSFWQQGLNSVVVTDEYGPDNVAAQILDNAIANKKRINPTDLFSIASGDDFRSFWQQGLNSVVVTDEYGPGAAIAYTKEYIANRKLDIKPTDLFSTPSVLDFFFLFADMVPNITTGLNAVLNNLPIVPVDVAGLIDFDASGLSEAINNAVKEAIGDRSYDEPQRLGFTSGRA